MTKQAKRKKNRKQSAEAILRGIHDMLYLDTDYEVGDKPFYNPNKEWQIELLEDIACVVELRIPRPKGSPRCPA